MASNHVVLPSRMRPQSASFDQFNITSRPQSASVTTARPFSSTNLSASVANSRFKIFDVQYEILCKNSLLCELAKEIPWKNLLELCTLQFHGVGDVLWRHGEHPHELAFILCGGFLARHCKLDKEEEESVHIVAEKLLTPGGSLATFAVDQGTPLRYMVVTAKFKSIILTLPAGKYKSVLKQISPTLRMAVQQVIVENEIKLSKQIKLPTPVIVTHHLPLAKSQKRGGATTQSTLKQSFSTPVLLSSKSSLSQDSTAEAALRAVDPMLLSALGLGPSTSWESLEATKPIEYEVDSSLLILHQSQSSNVLHVPSKLNNATQPLDQLTNPTTSSTVRSIAKKHTMRRLQSIKLPTSIDAFPNQNHRQVSMQVTMNNCPLDSGVIPKVRIGRLLQPLKKPTTLITSPGKCENDKGNYRQVLVADRIEPFRDM